MSRRAVGMIVLIAVVAFYALGTGFDFFYRFLYVLILVVGVGYVWAWLNLRGIDVWVERTADRGQVGSYLDGRAYIVNRSWLPKSWLEVVEATGPSAESSGRGMAMFRGQTRSWRILTYLSKRGVFRAGTVQVMAQDPFGLFRLRRDFPDKSYFVVHPAVEPLPSLKPRFAQMPSDSRVTRHGEQITSDVASVRNYQPGDGFRRIHWPYSARMNSLMVKEFDIGLASEAWVLLDLHSESHAGVQQDPVNNTEELAVSVAASLVNQLVENSVPVGLAASGDNNHLYRPGGSLQHLGHLMEVLSEVRAQGGHSIQEFIYDVRPNFNRYNTVTVITASLDPAWVSTLAELQKQDVDVTAVVVDPGGFGGGSDLGPVLRAAAYSRIPIHVVRRGEPLDDALGRTVGPMPGDSIDILAGSNAGRAPERG